jgi:hypothetical protein
MTENQPHRSISRSVLALLAGFVVVVILSLGTDFALHATGVFPSLGQRMPDGLFALATIYRTVYGIIGSYITARLAPNRPMGHAMVGGFIGLALSLVGAIVTWNRGPEFGPHWYPIALVVLALPTAWLGGFLRIRQLVGSSVPAK